ncbi:hypothetical protein, partial [Sutterella wadsworthensis]|uniref:hypothetical protein n=1 Tax=Sutterella wadsworthensis TaxID=40545 RepID=UPI003FEF0321
FPVFGWDHEVFLGFPSFKMIDFLTPWFARRLGQTKRRPNEIPGPGELTAYFCVAALIRA